MADLIPKERLQPSLLDRLTDDEPTKSVEAHDSRVLSLDQLKDCVIRDLVWLLNTENMASAQDLGEYPNVASSTVNYGITSLSGRIVDMIDSRDMEESVVKSIKRFEPRLLPNTVKVSVFVDEASMQPNALRFEIEATMWAQPWPLQLLVKAEADLDTGAFSVVSA